MGHAKDSGGVWGHSSAIGANSYIIFAVGDDLIQQKGFMGWAAALGIGFKPLLGCYTHDDGRKVTEQSFICNYDNLPAILAAGWLRGQESILILGACDSRDRRPARLQYVSPLGDDLLPRVVDLGVLQSVTRDRALAASAWTYDPDLKEYFITIDPDAIALCPHGLKAAMKEHFKQHERPLGDNQNTADLIRAYLAARRTI